MSLTSHLSNPRDRVRAWIDARFPDIGALISNSRRSLWDATTICATDGRPPTTSGIAIDYRLRYSFAVTAPAELIAYAGAADVLSRLLLEIDSEHPALWRTVEPLAQVDDVRAPGGRLGDRARAVGPTRSRSSYAAEGGFRIDSLPSS